MNFLFCRQCLLWYSKFLLSFDFEILIPGRTKKNLIFLALSVDSTFAKIKSSWWRCSVCWKSVLDLFWQMFALSVRASYLKWQTVWCHLSNKNLWEFSFCSSFSSTSSIFSLLVSHSYSYSFSSTSSIFSLPVSYSAKSGRQQRPPHAMHWPEIQNWFLPHLVGLDCPEIFALMRLFYSNSLPGRKRNSRKAKQKSREENKEIQGKLNIIQERQNVGDLVEKQSLVTW